MPATKASEYFPTEEMMKVRFVVQGRVRPVKGAKTGVFYGRFKYGDEFMLHRDDYAAHPVWFKLLEEAETPQPDSSEENEAENGSPVSPTPPATERTPFDLTVVKGVGDATAELIVNRFGIESAQDVVELTVDQLLSIPNLNRITAETILKAAQEHIDASQSA